MHLFRVKSYENARFLGIWEPLNFELRKIVFDYFIWACVLKPGIMFCSILVYDKVGTTWKIIAYRKPD